MAHYSLRSKIYLSLALALLLALGVSFFIWNYLEQARLRAESSASVQGEIPGVYSFNDYFKQTKADSYLVSLDLAATGGDSALGKPAMIRALGEGEPAYLPFSCERLHATEKAGICIRQSDVDTLATEVLIFDSSGKIDLVGMTKGHPNRARISSDGKYAAYTSFSSGDGYDTIDFSTNTYLVDVAGRKNLGDLADFDLIENGQSINPVDKNFWGVTFYRDSNHFLATVMYGGTPYLVDGNIAEKRLTIIEREVECPSLSPDETRIVYKKRGPGAVWRLHAMDLKSRQITPLAETSSIDDQVEWLDNFHVLYAHYNPQSGLVSTMSVPADGSGQPQVLLENAYSPSLLR